MRAGKLNKRVQLQMPHRVKGDDGGFTQTWVDVGSKRWAGIVPISGREANRSNQTIASTESRITMRYSSVTAEISETWRVLHGEKVYDIKRIANLESADEVIELTCEAGVNDG
ncbi:MAG: phage head closure protein [Oxalicibacterium faecigallinarum]|uniref:phage head closure protein n=1 Tax=Oxalicibacterium faecigallinarum TaxID=573741 RepID=UPI002808C76D|nr:phage head closure protein [Oxalicibacterium faecigallinarum]MDQ7970751.1 phage head closure protein [Oxalicibacterium faecigallinarum]